MTPRHRHPPHPTVAVTQEGLAQRFPKHTHVLATLKGTRKYRQAVEGEAVPADGEEEDDE